jgi:hypothetical protein
VLHGFPLVDSVSREEEYVAAGLDGNWIKE